MKEPETPQEKALSLLKEVLSDKEYKHYLNQGEIRITASDGSEWLIGQVTYVGNLLDVENHKWACAHPNMRKRNTGVIDSCGCCWKFEELPAADAWIAQILALKTDVQKVRKTALFYSFMNY